VLSHSADPSSSRIAEPVPPAPGGAPAGAPPALPGRPATGNGDVTTPARNFPAIASGPDDVTSKGPSVSSAYIYGYDSAGNPTLTDAGYCRSSDGKLLDR
jgi:hypothetical protein